MCIEIVCSLPISLYVNDNVSPLQIYTILGEIETETTIFMESTYGVNPYVRGLRYAYKISNDIKEASFTDSQKYSS